MPDAANVMFIDDEPHIRLAARQTLELADLRLVDFDTAEAALKELTQDFPGVLVCDIRLPGMNGLDFLKRALEIDPELPIVLVTGHGDISMAVGAMRDGAYDFLEKPYAPDRLTDVVHRALEKRMLTLENRALRRELEEQTAIGPRIIGRAPAMQRLRSLIRQVAEAEADVLILGETGTGKELVARSLHELSPRRTGNFVAVNCGAMPEQLMESELFGHEAGAFTGARGRRLGKLEHASGGTLFLDEIESMPMSMQVRLLRVLQERSLERLGSNQTVPLDLRVVAATKIDLREAAERGEFREDLYYRLNVVTLEIPPLRNRREDIPLLFQHFALVAGARYGKETSPLDAAHMTTLLGHSWPGNVRELRNAAERYVLLGEEADFDLDRLVQSAPGRCVMSLREQVESFERSLIEQELRTCKGNLSEATEALGIPRKTLHDKVVKYGLDRRQYR